MSIDVAKHQSEVNVTRSDDKDFSYFFMIGTNHKKCIQPRLTVVFLKGKGETRRDEESEDEEEDEAEAKKKKHR